MESQDRVLQDSEHIAALVRSLRRVAVLGMKTEEQAGQAAFYVPRYLQEAGLEVIPVPVYYPEVTHILGQPVYRRVADVPGPIDVVDVFRRPADLPAHLPDLLAARPRAVWLQSGIRHDAAAARLTDAGIHVVQDACLGVYVRRYRR